MAIRTHPSPPFLFNPRRCSATIGRPVCDCEVETAAALFAAVDSVLAGGLGSGADRLTHRGRSLGILTAIPRELVLHIITLTQRVPRRIPQAAVDRILARQVFAMDPAVSAAVVRASAAAVAVSTVEQFLRCPLESIERTTFEARAAKGLLVEVWQTVVAAAEAAAARGMPTASSTGRPVACRAIFDRRLRSTLSSALAATYARSSNVADVRSVVSACILEASARGGHVRGGGDGRDPDAFETASDPGHHRAATALGSLRKRRGMRRTVSAARLPTRSGSGASSGNTRQRVRRATEIQPIYWTVYA